MATRLNWLIADKYTFFFNQKVWEDQYEKDMKKYNESLIVSPPQSTASKIDWTPEKNGKNVEYSLY